MLPCEKGSAGSNSPLSRSQLPKAPPRVDQPPAHSVLPQEAWAPLVVSGLQLGPLWSLTVERVSLQGKQIHAILSTIHPVPGGLSVLLSPSLSHLAPNSARKRGAIS